MLLLLVEVYEIWALVMLVIKGFLMLVVEV
jgi:hypothetical protein